MHNTAPSLDPARAAESVLRGQQLSGAIVSAEELLHAIASQQPGDVVVRNAVLTECTFTRLTWRTKLAFESCTFFGTFQANHCQFMGRLIFDGCSFPRGAIFGNTTFSAGIELQSCVIADLSFIKGCSFQSDGLERSRIVAVEINGEFKIDACNFDALPHFQRVHFNRIAEFHAIEGTWTPLVFWPFEECHFGDRLSVDLPRQSTEICFDRCHFDDRTFARLFWGSGPARCGFSGSVIGGRVLLLREQNATAPGRGRAVRDAQVDLSQCVISGEIDLRRIDLKHVDLEETAITGGRVWIPRENIWPVDQRRDWFHLWQTEIVRRASMLLEIPPAWRRFWRKEEWTRLAVLVHFQIARLAVWRWPAWYRCGMLLKEQRVGRKPWSEVTAADLRSVASQYEQLRNSLATLPITDWEEDYCHFKCMEYKRRNTVARLRGPQATHDEESDIRESPGNSILRGGVLILVLTALTFLGCLIACPCALSMGIVVLMGISGLFGYARCCGVRFLKLCNAIVQVVVLQQMFGYGVDFLRVVLSAANMILAFAVLYGTATLFDCQLGRIVDSNGVSILEKSVEGTPPSSGQKETGKLEIEPVGFGIACSRLIYFSGITFATVGYGDYRPEGRLQIVAMLEGVTGAVMIALFTVFAARKFIRR